jgi:MFS family permease
MIGIIISCVHSSFLGQFFGQRFDPEDPINTEGSISGAIIALATGSIIGTIICTMLGHLSQIENKRARIHGIVSVSISLALAILIWYRDGISAILFGPQWFAIFISIALKIYTERYKLTAIAYKSESVGVIAMVLSNLIHGTFIFNNLIWGNWGYWDRAFWINPLGLTASMSVGILVFTICRNLKAFQIP